MWYIWLCGKYKGRGVQLLTHWFEKILQREYVDIWTQVTYVKFRKVDCNSNKLQVPSISKKKKERKERKKEIHLRVKLIKTYKIYGYQRILKAIKLTIHNNTMITNLLSPFIFSNPITALEHLTWQFPLSLPPQKKLLAEVHRK